MSCCYRTATLALQMFDGRMSISVSRKEYFCPLCKSLGNVLVPHVPPGLHANRLAAAAVHTATANTSSSSSSSSVRNSRQHSATGANSSDVAAKDVSAQGLQELAQWISGSSSSGSGVSHACTNADTQAYIHEHIARTTGGELTLYCAVAMCLTYLLVHQYMQIDSTISITRGYSLLLLCSSSRIYYRTLIVVFCVVILGVMMILCYRH
jgi:hypothetical protein